jgi:nucleoid DNA-binding protein
MDRIITILAHKYKLDEEVIAKTIRSEFDFVNTTMSEGNFESIRLHHFGCFGVKPNRLKQLNTKYEQV